MTKIFLSLFLVSVLLLAAAPVPLHSCTKEGDPAFYVGPYGETYDVLPGGTFLYTVAPANLAFVSMTCPDADTFCVHVDDSRGWVITGDPDLGECYLLDSGYLWWQDVIVSVPCDAVPGTQDTLFFTAAYCNESQECDIACGDCEDPNWYSGNPYYSTGFVILNVLEAPLSLEIYQDTLTLIDQGNPRAGVLFSICNNSTECAGPQDFGYRITSLGVIGSPLDTTGAVTGLSMLECEEVAAVLDASASSIGDTDTLTIVAWSVAEPVVYDTCVQMVEVAEVQFVPLLETPMLIVLAVVLLTAAAFIMRRRAALCVLIAMLALTVSFPASSREKQSGRVRPTRDFSAENALFDIEPWMRSGVTRAAVDTFTIIRFDFEALDWQGWTRVDNSAQVDTFFHVDDFDGLGGGAWGLLVPLEGMKSMWCGARPDAADPYLCAWVSPPGYGNGWVQYLISEPMFVQTPVTLSYLMTVDAEWDYDFVYVEYDTGELIWATLAEYDGIQVMDTMHTIGSAAPPIIYTGTDDLGAEKLQDSYNIRTKFRIRFTSDGAWSDQDGLWHTDGACIIDSITISDGTGLIDYEDFESWEVGAKQNEGSLWRAEPRPGYGMYSGLVSNLQDKDPCGENFGTQIVFFVGSDVPSSDYPGLYDTPSCTGAGGIEWPCQDEMVISPVIDMTKYSPDRDEHQDADIPSEELSQLGGAKLKFTVYRDLPVQNLVFYNWHVRTIDPVTLCPNRWEDRTYVYYGPEKEYIFSSHEIGDLVGNDPIQIAIGCVDMCDVWYGVYGDCAEHTPTPWIDNVEIQRYKNVGPQWYSRPLDLFQDNFPGGWGIEDWVRADAANDLMPSDNPVIRPGDSIVVSCDSPLGGGIAEDGLGPRIYMYTRCTYVGDPADPKPPLIGPGLEGTYGHYVNDVGEWTIIQGDTALVGSSRRPVDDMYMFDLNDSLLTRGYLVEYFFVAVDNAGFSTTHPPDAGSGEYFEFTCLPTLASNILYVDDYDGIGTREGIVQSYFDYAFRLIFGNDGVKPDRYDVNSPQMLVGNGLGGRASLDDLSTAYDVIIWDSGNLEYGTICTGYPGENDKSADAQILINWIELSDHDVGLWILGDNVAEDLSASESPSAQGLLINCGVTLFHEDYFDMTGGIEGGGEVNPLVEATSGSFLASLPEFYAYGGCPELNGFDVLEAVGDGVPSLDYVSETDRNLAAIQSEGTNDLGYAVRTMWCGFSFAFLRDVNHSDPPAAQTELVRQVLLWFLGSLPPPVGDDIQPAYTYRLDQNFPNPFNPATTLRFSLREKGHASIRVYDVAGRLVRVLREGVMEAGEHEVTWDGKNHLGLAVASGIYFVRMEAGDFREVRKLVLLR